MRTVTSPSRTEVPPSVGSHRSGFFGLNANILKIIALVTMTIDHIGAQFFKDMPLFRAVGRMSFPIFAYMIAEGCRYTKNKRRYFLQIFLLGFACQVAYFFVKGSLYQCVPITFSLSILCIYAIQWAGKHENGWWLPALAVLLVWGVTDFLPQALPKTNFAVDYGFWGVLLPVCIACTNDRRIKLLLTAVCLAALSLSLDAIQWWCLCALPILALYNGQRGKYKMKSLFYIYYPLHLVVIYFIALLCKK